MLVVRQDGVHQDQEVNQEWMVQSLHRAIADKGNPSFYKTLQLRSIFQLLISQSLFDLLFRDIKLFNPSLRISVLRRLCKMKCFQILASVALTFEVANAVAIPVETSSAKAARG